MTAPFRFLAIASLLTSSLALPAFANGQGKDESARVRVIHASPDTPAVDVLANDALAVFTSVQFEDVTRYAEVPANVYDIKVVPAGAGPDSAAIQANLNLFYGTDYTVVAVDTFENIKALVLVDDNETPEGNRARVRFLHAVPDAPAVDIKVADGPYLYQGMSFEDVGDYLTLPQNGYTLELRVAGTDTLVMELPDVAFRGGGVYTMLAIGLLGDGTLDVMIVEDSRREIGVTPFPPLVQRPQAGVTLQRLEPGGGLRR